MNYLLLICGLTITTFNISGAQNSSSCVTPNHQSGTCIVLDQCADLYNLIKSQQLSQQNITFLQKSHCGFSNGKVMICCSLQPNTGQPGTLLPEPGVCGAAYLPRILDGNGTKLDEFPWMALIEYNKNGYQKGYHCGGSLINNRYVITAAHCIKGMPSGWSLTGVRLGNCDISSNRNCVTYGDKYQVCSDNSIDVPVEKIIIHDNYDGAVKAQYNDIALLRLGIQIQFTNWISPVCLPSTNYLSTTSLDGVTLAVASWRKTGLYSSVSQIKLKYIVNGISLSNCNANYSKNNIVLRDGQMCVSGVEGIESCHEDSDGALVGLQHNTNKPNYFLAGIITFGPTPCGLDGWPDVYTRVGHYVDWIIQNMQP